jgi:gamma-glutamyl-gamma-aminobutyrate hydrolase PuuD
MLPRILVTCRRHLRKNKWVDIVSEHHLELILRAGGVPLPLPRVAGTAVVLDDYEPVDGLLVAEGEDIHPARHGREGVLSHLLQTPDPDKDELDFALVRRSLDRGTPFLGICRGNQVLNIACGGTLYVDVMTEKGSALKHIDPDLYDTYRHLLTVAAGTPMAGWYPRSDPSASDARGGPAGSWTIPVNSYHHQGVRDLAPAFRAMAWAPDGLVEGFYDPAHPFRVGLQFHPERMQDEGAGCGRLYESFVQAAARHGASRAGGGADPPAPSGRRRPRVFVTARRHMRKGKAVNFVGDYHIELILRHGGTPVLIPRVPGILAVLDAYGPMDALLIVEGEDVHPSRYGGGAIPADRMEEPDLEKDAIEFELVRRSLATGAPYLGLCRGSHLMNVACGGTLYADVMLDRGTTLPHIDKDPARYDAYRHPVRLLPGTPLAGWFGAGELRVNSYHHQGVKDLAPRFRPMAWAPDGLLEGYYDPAHPFRMGLQFHPERMQGDHPGCVKVYEAFLAAAKAFTEGI